MLVEKFIEELLKVPKGTNVCIMDWRKNLSHDIGDFPTEGIYSDFEIEMHTLTDDESEFYKDHQGKEFVPWLAINIENDDYDDDGKINL